MMKPNIHPEYRTVVFHDTSVDEYFKIGSTIKTDREIELDGVTYPYVTIDVSSKSHPFYTGKLRTVASEGNVARFTQRFGRFVSTKKGAGESPYISAYRKRTPSRLSGCEAKRTAVVDL